LKNILYIVSFPFNFTRRSVGGNISSANGVIKSLVNLGYNVDILSDDKLPNLDEKIKRINYNFLPFIFFRSFFTKISIRFFGSIFQKIENLIFEKILLNRLGALLKNNEYEFCYVRASPHIFVIRKLVEIYKVRLIVEVNKPLSMTPYNKDNTLNWPKNNKEVFVSHREKILYDSACAITVDSNLRAKWITDFVGNYHKKIIINHNGVDTNIFKPSSKDYKLLNRLGFNSSDIVVGMASSFRWYNDLDELFQIIKLSLDKNIRIKFLLISADKKKANEIDLLINRFNLSKFVKLKIAIPFNNMPNFLNLCDICLSHFNFHSKWPHNCSIKHLEYLALAKPVVATDVGEVNFAIENKINGFLCEEGQINQYVDSIDLLANNANIRKKFGLAGRNKAKSLLTWDQNIKRILDFISKREKLIKN